MPPFWQKIAVPSFLQTIATKLLAGVLVQLYLASWPQAEDSENSLPHIPDMASIQNDGRQ
jgi:hypothetical protein